MACPRTHVRGHEVSRVTGEMVPVRRGCARWDCRVCGPQLLRRHMAHFREVLAPDVDRLQFATLTLRPADADRLNKPERVHALWSLFDRLVRRIGRRDGRRPAYVAQVDLNDRGETPHLHAIVGTDLEPADVTGLWVAVGGGLDDEVVPLRGSLDDLARAAGYVVKGSRWWRRPRLRVSHGIGYHTVAAKRERRRHAASSSDEDRDGTWTFEFEPREDRERTGRRVPALDPFVSAAQTPEVLVTTHVVFGTEYAIRAHYADERVALTADRVRRVGKANRPRYDTLARPRSRASARRFLARYDARRRQRLPRSAREATS